MYVKRCGFYLDDGNIVRKDVWVKWDMDMPKSDRYIYANLIRDALGNIPMPYVDTTTASSNYLGKKLSGYWNKIEGLNCFEAYDSFVKDFDADKEIPGISEYIYISAIEDNIVGIINGISTFSNMFFNPDKQNTCEALACVILKLLLKQNNIEYIMDIEKFVHWYYVNTSVMKIIQAGEKPKDEELKEGVVITESSSDYYEGFNNLPDPIDDELPFS